jgi:hypothetical protein
MNNLNIVNYVKMLELSKQNIEQSNLMLNKKNVNPLLETQINILLAKNQEILENQTNKLMTKNQEILENQTNKLMTKNQEILENQTNKLMAKNQELSENQISVLLTKNQELSENQISVLLAKNQSVIINQPDKELEKNINLYDNIQAINATINNLDIKNIIALRIFPKTIEISAHVVSPSFGNTYEYFINKNDKKLYNYTKSTDTTKLVNGNYVVVKSNSTELINKAWTVTDGVMTELVDYFNGDTSKLFINGSEYNSNGTMIITDDYKLYIQINDLWIKK